MFQAMRMLFIMVESPLHAGMGRGLGAVDLPIQRERTTGYPMVQASSIKGCLRSEARGKLTEKELAVIFGPETDNAAEHAGALSTGDARLLLFPVRSLAGVFAWTTSVNVLARFRRQAEMVGLQPDWQLPNKGPASEAVWVSNDALKAGGRVVLEEFAFTPSEDAHHSQLVQTVGDWLAANALPDGEEYAYWRAELPKKLCILPEDALRDFALYATEVETHIRLKPETKTVDRGALWTAESLPMDTLLYAPLLASPSRAQGHNLSAEEVLQKVMGLNLIRMQLGGDETTGQGLVALRLAGGK